MNRRQDRCSHSFDYKFHRILLIMDYSAVTVISTFSRTHMKLGLKILTEDIKYFNCTQNCIGITKQEEIDFRRLHA